MAMAKCVCGAPAPALEGLGAWQIIVDLDVPAVVALLAGELDHARCDAGCWLNIKATVVFKDSESDRRYVAPGNRVDPDEMAANIPAELWASMELVADLDVLRRLVEKLICQRAALFVPAISGGPEELGDIDYLCGNWRLFTPAVMAAVCVIQTGCLGVIESSTHPESAANLAALEKVDKRLFRVRQAAIWSSMLIDWMNGDGIGSFEDDLVQYVDQMILLGDPIWFAERMDELPTPEGADLARIDVYHKEAFRASLYAQVGRPNPHDKFWAVVWMSSEISLRMADKSPASEFPELRISKERVRRTVSADSARYASATLVDGALKTFADDPSAGSSSASWWAHFQEVLLEFGFAEQLATLFAAARIGNPIEEVADDLISALGKSLDVDGLYWVVQGMAKVLVDARRVDDLKRVVDAMLVASPAYALNTKLWYYRMLWQMRMPTRLLKEAGEAPDQEEVRLPATAQGQLLQLRALALRALGRSAEALTLFDSAERTVLDEPNNKQGLVTGRARLVRELGSPATALAQLEALLIEVVDPDPHLHESLMGTLLAFGRYREAADQGRAAYVGSLRDWTKWPVGRFAAQTMLCQVMGGSEPDADLVSYATDENEPADPQRDLIAATALLIYGLSEADVDWLRFLDRVRSESSDVLEQALDERDVRTATRALYVAALYDHTYRPNEALQSWSRLLSVISREFGITPTDGYLYMAANLISSGEMARARSLLKDVLGDSGELGQDSRLEVAAWAGAHTAREIDSVAAAMLVEPGTTHADLRLVAELRRGVASRAIQRIGEEPAWRKHGLDDEVVAAIAPDHGRVGVLECVSDGTKFHALITVVDADGSVTSTTVAPPSVDLGRVAVRMRSRLSTWRRGRAGDPFDVAEWQVCQTWLDRLLDGHLAQDDHLVIIPSANWPQLPWHVAAFNRVTCSYEPSWVALLSTVTTVEPPQRHWREGVVVVPRVGDPVEITDAMEQYVANCGAGVRVLNGVAADRAAVMDLLASVDLATLLTHGYTSTVESEVALMLAADDSLPLAHSVAASSDIGRKHRFSWRECAELSSTPRVILSAACSTGGGHIVGLGEHLGIYNVLRQTGLRAFVAPQWDIMASDLLPILAEIRTHLLAPQAGLGQCVRRAVQDAIRRGVSAWSAHALTLEGDWR